MKQTKSALRIRLLVEVMEAQVPVAGALNKEPVRRGLEVTVPLRATEGQLVRMLEDLTTAAFGMINNELDVFPKIITRGEA